MARVLDENSEVYNLSNLATKIPIAWLVNHLSKTLSKIPEYWLVDLSSKKN